MQSSSTPAARFVWVAVLALAAAGPAAAQDMALAQVLPDNETWQSARGDDFPLLRSLDPKRAVLKNGGVYAIDAKKQVVYLPYGDAGEQHKLAAEGFAAPSALILWPDQSTLVVADADDRHLSAFRIEADGRLTGREPYYPLRLPHLAPGRKQSGARAMTYDTAGRLYVATTVGVQIFDPTGRLSGVLPMPGREPVTAIAFGGPQRDILTVACGDKTYQRKLKATGIK